MLYANPGYAIRTNELPERESDEILEFLFDHQLQEKYRHVHRWSEGDVLLGTTSARCTTPTPITGPTSTASSSAAR